MTLQAVALMGATGSGKSALAMQVAEAAGSSIICCDSMQLYKGLDIGTAKPTLTERESIPHFLVDCCTLPDLYSAARWADEAREVIRSENRAGRRPLIVGGTGFYLKALIEGFAEIPPEDPEVRTALEKLQAESGTEALYAELCATDTAMAATLKAHDTQRIMRALAVLRSTGRSLLEWQQQAASVTPIDCPVMVLSLPRELLRQRIAERFVAMMEAGWLDEVKWLASLGLPDTHPAMRAVGYRQLLDVLAGDLDLKVAVEKGITATRRYAKRQVTWFANQTPNAVHGDAAVLADMILQRLKAA